MEHTDPEETSLQQTLRQKIEAHLGSRYARRSLYVFQHVGSDVPVVQRFLTGVRHATGGRLSSLEEVLSSTYADVAPNAAAVSAALELEVKRTREAFDAARLATVAAKEAELAASSEVALATEAQRAAAAIPPQPREGGHRQRGLRRGARRAVHEAQGLVQWEAFQAAEVMRDLYHDAVRTRGAAANSERAAWDAACNAEAQYRQHSQTWSPCRPAHLFGYSCVPDLEVLCDVATYGFDPSLRRPNGLCGGEYFGLSPRYAFSGSHTLGYGYGSLGSTVISLVLRLPTAVNILSGCGERFIIVSNPTQRNVATFCLPVAILGPWASEHGAAVDDRRLQTAQMGEKSTRPSRWNKARRARLRLATQGQQPGE